MTFREEEDTITGRLSRLGSRVWDREGGRGSLIGVSEWGIYILESEKGIDWLSRS